MKSILYTTEKNQPIQLTDCFFSPPDARNIVFTLLDKKTKHHNIKQLPNLKTNVVDHCLYNNKRIKQLIKVKQKAIAFNFESLERTDNFLEIESTLNTKETSKLN